MQYAEYEGTFRHLSAARSGWVNQVLFSADSLGTVVRINGEGEVGDVYVTKVTDILYTRLRNHV